jgi:hypothetical protein
LNNINSMELFLFSFSLAQQPYTLPTHVPLFFFKDEQKKNLENNFALFFLIELTNKQNMHINLMNYVNMLKW